MENAITLTIRAYCNRVQIKINSINSRLETFEPDIPFPAQTSGFGISIKSLNLNKLSEIGGGSLSQAIRKS